MKIIRLILALSIALTSTISMAHAQSAPANAIAYIPLMEVSTLPAGEAFLQSQAAYNKIAPLLQALSLQGVVYNHRVNYGFGVLTVIYQSGADLSALGNVYTDINEAVNSIQFPSNSAEVSALAVPHFTVANECFEGTGLGASSIVDAVMRLPNGTIIGALNNVAADVSGVILSKCFNFQSFDGNLPEKFSITIKLYDSTKTTLLGTYKAVVPSIQFIRIDKAKAIIGGKGLPNRSYTITLTHNLYDAALNTTTTALSGSTSAKGYWAKDFGAVPFKGGDTFLLEFDVNSNLTVNHTGIAPVLQCGLAGIFSINNGCQVNGLKNKTSRITRVRNGVSVRFTPDVVFGSPGSPNVKTSIYTSIILKPGDVIKDPGAGVSASKIPKINILIDAGTDVVTIKGQPNNVVILAVLTGAFSSKQGYLDATGMTTINFAPSMDFTSGTSYKILLMRVEAKTGNQFGKIYNITAP